MKLKLSWLAACSSLFLIGCAPDSRVALVQNGTIDGCPNTTIKEMVDSYVGDPSWWSGDTEDGIEIVNIEGKIIYSEKEVDMVLQYTVDSEKQTYDVTAMEFNGIPQNNFMVGAIFANMCEEVSN